MLLDNGSILDADPAHPRTWGAADDWYPAGRAGGSDKLGSASFAPRPPAAKDAR